MSAIYDILASEEDTSTDELDKVTLEDLTKRHPEFTKWKNAWADFRLIYKGGEEFLRAAGQQGQSRSGDDALIASLGVHGWAGKRRRFLHQLDGEPNRKYNSRWERAYLINYVEAIVDYFRHWLFSQPPIIRAGDEVDAEPPDWYEEFNEDCNGGGKDFLDFIRDVWLEVMIGRRAGWLVSRNVETDKAELCSYSAEDICDWQKNQGGELEWILLRDIDTLRQFPQDRVEVQTYIYVDRDRWRKWQVLPDGKLTVVGDLAHGLGIVPFVEVEIPPGLWVLDKLASWQIDLFNKLSMLSYGQLVSCFLQPYIKSNQSGATAQSRIIGENILLHLLAGDDKNRPEEFGWIVPNVDPLKYLSEYLKEQRDEGYRIVHQMSLAVDSQAIGAIARSGASKIEDRRATEIILTAYGSYVTEAIKKTLDLISMIHGDNTKWNIDGYDNFQVSTLDEEIQTAALIQTLGIPSPTFEKEILTDFATGRLMSKKAEGTKEAIRKEIQDAIDQKQEAMLAMPQDPNAPQPSTTPMAQIHQSDGETGRPAPSPKEVKF